MSRYLLGYDVGSSSVKASIIDTENGAVIGSATSPSKELPISAPKEGWAEQDPAMWWEHVIKATTILKESVQYNADEIKAIGISYQMHGLVMVDKNLSVLYPSIIWCDSRAVAFGDKAFTDIGTDICLSQLLNSPGNFTASKLAWVKQNLPDIYEKIYKIMLPGDYIALKMTGELTTTPSGLSEGILWDFKNKKNADIVLDYYGIPEHFLPEVKDTFCVQGELTKEGASELGLAAGIPIAYRAGDQPNNALSLNVLNPGEIAATAGTSGVVYGVGDKASYDPHSRVNTFAHVNYTTQTPRYGTLLCVNGTGILNSWIKHNIASIDYEQMNSIAESVPIGCEGLCILPFGNGAERSLGNKNINASIHGLSFNIHTKAHMIRAAQEGIVFALNYGLEIMREMGIPVNKVRAGFANMFLSPVFSQAFATVSNVAVELYNTDGSQGAARGAGIGADIYKNAEEAFTGLTIKKVIEPENDKKNAYAEAYNVWTEKLSMYLTT